MKNNSISKLAAVVAAAAVTLQSSSAAAVECILAYPTLIEEAPGGPERCGPQGSSEALVAHFLTSGSGFNLYVDMVGGTTVAVAYGIDENGTRLSRPEYTVADQNNDFEKFTDVPVSQLYAVPGEDIPHQRNYEYPVDMAATYVLVI